MFLDHRKFFQTPAPTIRQITRKQSLKTTTTTYIPITTKYISTTTENLTTFIETITFYTYSFIINTTQENNNIIRNKILISLFISLLLISLCIGLSYCIFIYFNHYLNTNFTNKQNLLVLNRTSFASSVDSNSDTQFNTYKTKDNISPKTNDEKTNERHSPTDSFKLFRY